MKYAVVKKALFIERPNRFLARVMIDRKDELVHVKTTGRCREILQKGASVILEETANANRKTKYSMIAAYKNDMLINLDSQVPNLVVYESIVEGRIKELPGYTKLKREVVYGNSRFDLYFENLEQRGFIEVKGVTLETEGIALFPDAPTIRGTKHIYELINAVEEGYTGILFFLIQMKGVTCFTPNEKRDPEFTKALKLAKKKGVTILAYDSVVQEDGIMIGDPIRVQLD